MIQWLGLHACPVGGTGSIPGRGTKIPQAARRGQKRKNLCFSFLALRSGVFLSGSNPLCLQPSKIPFLHFSHLSFEPASHWVEEVSASLPVLRSGCWELGCDGHLAWLCRPRGSTPSGLGAWQSSLATGDFILCQHFHRLRGWQREENHGKKRTHHKSLNSTKL